MIGLAANHRGSSEVTGARDALDFDVVALLADIDAVEAAWAELDALRLTRVSSAREHGEARERPS